MENYETIRVSFTDSIYIIDRMFNVEEWGVSNLKEWIDSYETTRFAQIDSNTAIITSEYNMDFVKEWLKRYISIGNIQSIN